ncbi:glycerol-3-phosphate dehydrogenase, mitochondrial precursor [Camelus ferus]|nr:glycerol-3-phosphate dehydrogenase, mitochondrial precursor [Camelus ferus]
MILTDKLSLFKNKLVLKAQILTDEKAFTNFKFRHILLAFLPSVSLVPSLCSFDTPVEMTVHPLATVFVRNNHESLIQHVYFEKRCLLSCTYTVQNHKVIQEVNLAFVEAADYVSEPVNREPPSREAQILTLKNTSEFDILVIGGGATGSGCALDAVTRGLKTALVERDDFSSGTSSRSTKLIHGGVRYLQKAIMKLDIEQYRLVKEALHERANLLEIAPHLSAPLPIMLPIYKWWQLPYYWVGIKLYDLVAGSNCLKSSYVLSKSRALEHFPMLQKDRLVGAIVYYDGQHNDARMNLAIALTAARYGAATANYMEVVSLLKKTDPQTGKERVSGARCKDVLTGQEFDVRAKCVINATGPFTDTVRKMDDKNAAAICQPSAGVHIVMPGYYSPESMGLLDPATSDGRVIFFLPWQKMTIAGTTDTPTDVTHHPVPSEEDINFILNEVRNYLSCDVEVRRGDVLAAWSGIRPLVTDPKSADTQSISRNHVVDISESGLITIAGGKWTTYRSMAEDTINAAVKTHDLKAGPSRTVGLFLQGGKDWSPTLYIRLVQDYGLESEVAQHLAATYGDKAFEVAKMASVTGKRWPIVGVRLVSEFPYIEAEEELETARKFLYYEMGYKSRSEQLTDRSEISLLPSDIDRYKKRFHKFDADQKGFITIVDVQRVLESIGVQMDENTLHEILNEVDLNKNGQVELNEFLQLMSAIQKGRVSGSRLAILMKTAEENLDRRVPIPVDRSCGGLYPCSAQVRAFTGC